MPTAPVPAHTARLWRPLGLNELKLIFDSGYRQYPPRLSWQPIFYPVTNFAYAEQITREWNVPGNGDHCGFVTEFDVDQQHLAQYAVQNVGGDIYDEHWIPAEELEAFNARIVGCIRVVASRYSETYQGVRIPTGALASLTIREQLAFLETIVDDKAAVFTVFEEAEYAILTNLGYWKQFCPEQGATVSRLIGYWGEFRPEQQNNHC